MNENYKNILEDLTDFGNTLHKQSLKNNFQKRLNATKSKIDTLYNLSFYDVEFSIPNFNALLAEYKEYRSIKKKVFLFTIKIKGFKDLYLLDMNQQAEIKKRLNEIVGNLSNALNELKIDAIITYFNSTLNIIFDKKEDCIMFFKNKAFEKTRDLLGYRKFTEIVSTYSKNKKNLLDAYRKNLYEIKKQEERLNEKIKHKQKQN